MKSDKIQSVLHHTAMPLYSSVSAAAYREVNTLCYGNGGNAEFVMLRHMVPCYAGILRLSLN